MFNLFKTDSLLIARKTSLAKTIILISLAMGLSGCGVQSIPTAKNEVEAALAETTNQYKRRSDLIPNLVQVVKGYASHEKETLEGVIEARSKATSVNIDARNLKAEDVAKFQAAQSGLTQALSKLMMVAEQYPNLKADANFRDLQAQLEGTENRITVARNRYIETIKLFNNLVTVFPTSLTNSLFFKNEKMPQWTVENAQSLEKAPEIKF
jgi:LemA protein